MTTKDAALRLALDIPMSEVQFSAPEKNNHQQQAQSYASACAIDKSQGV